ncbi:hypothetical protein LCGC14_2704390 [marine sediment metagenome]|uniref:Uncharacterized protein n=1 Tax=marine sediment metagenome TaxID=412755 RepID=A0A0F9C6L4_9ZZZZ
MPEIQIKLDIERIVNLVQAFEWVKVGEKIENGKVTISFEKRVSEVDPEK